MPEQVAAEDECEYCGHDEFYCLERHPEREVPCTRRESHDGPHAACGDKPETHPLVEWEGS